MEPGSLAQGQPIVVQGTIADPQGLIQAASAVQTNILSAAPSTGLTSVVGNVQLQLPVSATQIAAAHSQVVSASIPQSTVSQAQVAEILQWQAPQQQLANAVVAPSNVTTILQAQSQAASTSMSVVSSAVPVLSAQSVSSSPSPHNTLVIYHPAAQNSASTSSPLRFVRPATQGIRLQQPLTKVLTTPRPRTPIQTSIRPKSVGAPVSVATQQVLQSLDVSNPKETAVLQRLNQEASMETNVRLSSPRMTLLQPSSVSVRAHIRQKTARPKTTLPPQQTAVQPRMVVPTRLTSPSPRTVQLKMPKTDVKASVAEAAAASAARKPVTPGETMVDCSQLSLNQSELVVGQEYHINYGGGRKLLGEWDGEFFRVKPTAADAKQLVSTSLTSSPVRGGGNSRKRVAGTPADPVLTHSPQVVSMNGQVVTSPSGKDSLARPPIRQLIQKKVIQSSESSSDSKVSQKRTLKPSEEGKYAVCNHCGNMSADYNTCDGCHKELPDNPRYFVPEKNPEKVMKLDTGQKVVTRQGFYGRVVKVASLRKTPARPAGRAPKKQEAPEMVTILSSDDEEQEGSVPSQPSSTASTPKCLGEAALSRISKAEDQNGQALKVARITPQSPAEAVKVTRKTEVKLKLRSVRIGTLRSREADPLNISVENFQIRFTAQDKQKFNMVLATTEVVKIDACMTTKSTTLFLHTTGGCGAKIRQGCKLEAGKEPYFDPCGKSECHKYIILIVDDMTKSNIMMFRQICMLICEDFSKQEFLHEMTNADADQRLIACLMEESGGGGGSGGLQQLSRLQLAKSRANSQTLLQNAFSLLVTPAKDGGSQIQLVSTQLLPPMLAGNSDAPADSMEEGEEEELMDRSRSPSPFQASFNAPIVKLFTYPPPPATGGISVTNEDLFCLNEGEFLNDVIIDFYLKYVFTEMLSEEQQQKTHLFSSFFYRRLTQKQSRRQTNEDQANMSLPERRHSRVKTWTRHVDIFSKDFIIVPINESAHWYLAIICFPWLQKPIVAAKTVKEEQDSTSAPASNSTSESTEAALQSSEGSQESAAEEKPKTPAQTKTAAKAAARILKSSTYIAKQPCILIFDSLSGLGRSGVVRTLREYIQTEWNMRKGSTEGMRLYDKDNMRGANPKCPQQTNFSDCGIYVLQYVECFFRSPIKDYGIPMNLSNWFEESEAKHKREDLRLLILGLQQELNPDLKYDPTKDGCLPELPTAAASLDESMDASQSSSS